MADFLKNVLGGKKPADTPAAKADSGTCWLPPTEVSDLQSVSSLFYDHLSIDN